MTGLRTSLWWATRSEAFRRSVVAAAVLTGAAVGYAALTTGPAGRNSDNDARAVPVERVYTSNDLDVYLAGRASPVAPGRKSDTSDDSSGSKSEGSKSDKSTSDDASDSGDSSSSSASGDAAPAKKKAKGKNSGGSNSAGSNGGGHDSSAAPDDGSAGAGAGAPQDPSQQGGAGPLTTPGVVAGGPAESGSSPDDSSTGERVPNGYSDAGGGTSYSGDSPRRPGGDSGGGASPGGGPTAGDEPSPARQSYSPGTPSPPPIARGSGQDGQGTAMFACSEVVADLAGLERALATAVPNEVICYQRAASTNVVPDYSQPGAPPRGGAASYGPDTGGDNPAPAAGSIPDPSAGDYSAGDPGRGSDNEDGQTNGGHPASEGSDDASGAATGTSSSAAFRPTGDQKQLTIWLTGYSWQDNNPPGSSTVSHPVLHREAGGTGTYADPITVAVPGQGDGIWKAGARFYLPSVQRYVIVEDTGASAPPSGQDGHLDMWIGGQGGSKSATDACMDQITGTGKPAILNPPPGLKVMPGPIFSNGTCNVPGGSPGGDRS